MNKEDKDILSEGSLETSAHENYVVLRVLAIDLKPPCPKIRHFKRGIAKGALCMKLSKMITLIFGFARKLRQICAIRQQDTKECPNRGVPKSEFSRSPKGGIRGR